MSLDCGRKSRLPERICADTGEHANTGKAPGPQEIWTSSLWRGKGNHSTNNVHYRPTRQMLVRAALLDIFFVSWQPSQIVLTPLNMEAIRFLNARCSQILHTGPLIHQVANHYINKQYIWSGYKSQLQLFLPPAFFPLDKSNRYFNMYLCGYTPTYSLTHSIKNTQEAETLLN